MDAWGCKPEAGFGGSRLFGGILGNLCAIHEGRTSLALLRAIFDNSLFLRVPPWIGNAYSNCWEWMFWWGWRSCPQWDIHGTFMGANVGLESCYTG